MCQWLLYVCRSRRTLSFKTHLASTADKWKSGHVVGGDRQAWLRIIGSEGPCYILWSPCGLSTHHSAGADSRQHEKNRTVSHETMLLPEAVMFYSTWGRVHNCQLPLEQQCATLKEESCKGI